MTARDAARAIWQSALDAGDVVPLVRRHLRVDSRHARVLVLGCGKASGAMAAVAEQIVGDRIAGGFVVVKDGYGARSRRIEVVEAGHPVPDERGSPPRQDFSSLPGAPARTTWSCSSSPAGARP